MLGAFMVSVPAPVMAQSLKEALALAYETNPALKAARADYQASTEELALSQAQGRPQVSGSLSYEFQDGEYDPGTVLDLGSGFDTNPLLQALTGNAGFGTTNVGIQVRQSLFQGFRVRNSARQADASVRAAGHNLRATEQNLLAEGVRLYLSVNAARQSQKVAEQSVATLTRQVEAAGIRYRAGQNTKTDTARLEASLERAKSTHAGARANLMAAQAQYQSFFGQLPESLEDAPALPSIPESQQALLERAKTTNPSLKAAVAAEDAARQAVKVAKGTMAPSLSATASYGVAQDSFIQGDEAKSATLTTQLTIPFYQGGGEYAGIRRAKAAHRAARQRVIQAERNVEEAVLVVWSQYQAATATVGSARAAERAAELAFTSVTEESRLGLRSSLDVLVAEQELSQARLGVIEAELAHQQAAYNILQIEGTLTADGLALPVTTFDIEAERKKADGRWFGAK